MPNLFKYTVAFALLRRKIMVKSLPVYLKSMRQNFLMSVWLPFRVSLTCSCEKKIPRLRQAVSEYVCRMT